MNTLPTKPGFYWYRYDKTKPFVIVNLSIYYNELVASVLGNTVSGIQFIKGIKGEWHEITQPKEDGK